MGEPFVGEIRMFGGSFAPAGWAMCQGQLMPISQNETLFNLIGTTYGGDGQSTFALPDLRGRIPLHAGQGPGISQSYQLGETGGVESVTLSAQQIPVHNHAILVSQNQTGNIGTPGNSYLATLPTGKMYVSPSAPFVNLAANALQPIGGSQPHENMQPYLCITYIISRIGVFPQQN